MKLSLHLNENLRFPHGNSCFGAKRKDALPDITNSQVQVITTAPDLAGVFEMEKAGAIVRIIDGINRSAIEVI